MIIIYSTKVDTQNFLVTTPEEACKQCGNSRNLLLQKDVLTVKLFWLIPIFRWTSYSVRCSVCGKYKKLSKKVGEALIDLSKIQNLEKDIEEDATSEVFEEFSNEPTSVENIPSTATRQITITRKKAFYGSLIPIICKINDNEVCRLKNGETQSFTATANECIMSMDLQNNQAYSVTIIPAGDNDLHYEMSLKCKGLTNTILLTPIK